MYGLAVQFWTCLCCCPLAECAKQIGRPRFDHHWCKLNLCNKVSGLYHTYMDQFHHEHLLPTVGFRQTVDEHVGCPRGCSSEKIIRVSTFDVSTIDALGCPRRCSSGATLVTSTVDALGCPRRCSSGATLMCVSAAVAASSMSAAVAASLQ